MNRSNTGANTNTLQILLDILIMAIAYALDVLVFGRELLQNQHIFFFVLFSVFTLIYVLANKEAYLYNVTLFYYLDRVHRKLTKSFLTAMIATSAMLYFMTSVEKTKKFYIVFLIIAYVLVCIKMFFNKKLMRYLQRKTIPRTAFVGKVGEFNKFRYFLDKTSIHIEPVGYIAMKRENMELAPEGTYLGCLEDLEN